MDYGRIYRDFIADRRIRESSLTGYVERHHIVPKSRGGSNDPDNLIKLTAEDHFFAHLLLAKMHGGWMWMAVKRMSGSRREGLRHWVRRRFMYAVARKRVAEEMSRAYKGRPGKRGSDNGHYDFEVRAWTNLDTGEIRHATTADMWTAIGGTRPHWTSVVKGDRRSMLGWTTNPDGIRIRGLKGKRQKFVNRDGRSFHGTQSEFCTEFGVGVAAACRISRHRSVSMCGWRLEGVLDRQPHCRKADGRPARSKAA